MLPKTGEILKREFEIEKAPSKTFRIKDDYELAGFVDGQEAVKQAVYCILNTERYDWLIYSWNHGVEFENLYGRPMNVVKSKIKKRIKEALMQDDRVLGVDAFSFVVSGRKLTVNFTVNTQYGDIQAAKEVET